MRVFLDADILFSASLPDSRLAGFLKELRRDADLLTSAHARTEAERNIAGNADFLLTGDKRDFGHLFGKAVRGVQIVTVRMLLAELSERGILAGS